MRRRRWTLGLLELVVRLATMVARMVLDPHTPITKI